MKAKEYASKFYIDAAEMDDIYAARRLMGDFADETQTIGKARRVTTDAGMFGVLNEMSEKWRAVCRLIPQLLPGGYDRVVKEILPGVYDAWQAYRQKVKGRRS